MITLTTVRKDYSSEVRIGPVDLQIPAGGITALIGPNGAGKSTLLTMIGRLQGLDEGAIEVAGYDITRTASKDLAKILSILRQENHFITRLTIRQLVGFGPRPGDVAAFNALGGSDEIALRTPAPNGAVWNVQVTLDGRTGVNMAAAFQPDVAFVDIAMPQMDGMELLRRLREFSSMPVIFLTSKDDELDEALGEVIGQRINEWDVRSPDPVRSRETPFANYIADTMRASVDADVALTNGGGIRSSQVYEPGDITRRDIVAILPFMNTIVLVDVSGATILAALENGVSRVEHGDGRFAHVSGMAYVWDPGADPGERIVEVTVDGEPLDEAETYTLATNDFLLAGGDGYTMLADGDVIIAPEEGRLMSDVITDQIIADEVVEVSEDGRISTAD